jgi:hypothetical protein
MPEAVFYSEEVHPTVAQYIAEHGGKVQTERVAPAWVFHKVTVEYTTCALIGGCNHPIYRYTLADGGTLLVQILRAKGLVPGYPDQYWTALYVRKGDNGKNAAVPTETS